MAQNSKTPTVSLKTQRTLVRRSEKSLRLGWEIGPLKGQRACCKKSAAEIAIAKVEDGALTLSQMTTPRNRCKSRVCRPGDPYGCSMAHARGAWVSMTGIIDGWQQAGHSAYVCLLEAKGGSSQSLESVLKVAKNAMNSATGGDTWSDRLIESSVLAQILALDVTKAKSGGWVVRRWIVLMAERDLQSHEVRRLSEQVLKRWSRRVGTFGDQFSSRTVPLRYIDPAETRSLTQLIARCVSPFEPLEQPFADSLKLAFGLSDSEQAPAELAERYQEAASELKEIFSSANRDEFLVRENGVFGFMTKHVGGGSSVRPIALPAQASDFAEYAVLFFGKRVWTAQKRAPEGAGVLWNSLLKEAKTVKYRYIEYNYGVSQRKVKKV